VVGRGNNGGDGWAAARRLAGLGAGVWVVAVDGIDADTTDEARTSTATAGSRPEGARRRPGELARALALGRGRRRRAARHRQPRCAPRRGRRRRASRCVTRTAAGDGWSPATCPRGCPPTTARPPRIAVRADVTVTFGGIKRGLVLHPGAAHAGVVRSATSAPATRRRRPLAGAHPGRAAAPALVAATTSTPAGGCSQSPAHPACPARPRSPARRRCAPARAWSRSRPRAECAPRSPPAPTPG
jgi:hypothetical protein